ncbi:tetratricopeptide repeat protein [bacterium]|nr:MAG: tetratricopeptide repeat protein [bacterium]
MESSLGSNFHTVEGNVTPPPEKPKKGFTSKIVSVMRFLKRFWYIVIVILLVIAGLITWQVIYSNQESAWKRTNDQFARANYEAAYKEIENMAIPTDSERLRVYGQTMLATRHLDKSLAAYQKLYDQKKDPSVKLIIGNIYNEQKKYDEAIKAYREVIADNKTNVQAYVNIATVYKLQGNASEAAKVATEAVKENPTSVTLLELKVSMLMDNKNTPEYKAAVAELKKLNPQDPLLQSLREV